MIFINPPAKVNKEIPNIGLAYAATYFNVKVIDLNTKSYPYNRFLRQKTDILGVSVKSLTYNEALRLSNLYKKKYPDAKIKSISGFLDVQCCYPYLDFEDKISYCEPFSDKYSFPNYELFDSFKIFQKNWRSGAWGYAIMTSQGCPYKCVYCVSRERPWLARSAENSFEEIKMAKEKWGIKSFQILDDCFNVDKKRIIEFCNLVKPLNLKWFCTNGIRADKFDEEIAQNMALSGCAHLSFGIESTDSDVLLKIKKGETFEEIKNAIKIAKKYFKSVNGFFVIGLPGSSYEIDMRSLEWAQKSGINAHFSYYVPIEKQTYFDEVFYGSGAHPISEVYPKSLQKKIYKMTEKARPGYYLNGIKKFLTGLKG